MNQSELHNDMKETFNKCLDIAKKKNDDYADEADPFANFRGSEIAGVPAERGILIRMMDKMNRIGNGLQKEFQVEDERMDDTIEDLINYAAILKAYLNHEVSDE